MKVLHSLDSFNRGGTETLALDVCRNAKRLGLDLTLVATGSGDLEAEFEGSGVDYIRMRRKLPIDPNIVWQLRKIIKERRIRIVQGYQPVEVLHLYLATLGLKGVKTVMAHHGGGLFLASRKNRIAARFLAPRVDANTACSRGLFPWLRDEVGLDTRGNFHLMYNGVDRKRLEPGKSPILKELEIEDNGLLMGMVANFLPTRTKDQMTICRALPKVFEEFEDANFVFVGKVKEGGEDYFDECVRICESEGIGEKVFFVGSRDGFDSVPDILASLDLFVFSSLHEGLPIAVIEAMLVGVPLVVSDIPPLLETTDDGKCAEVFEAEDPEDLAQKILRLLRDSDLRKKLADEAYEFAMQNFSVEAHIRGLKALYSELLNEEDNTENLSGTSGTGP